MVRQVNCRAEPTGVAANDSTTVTGAVVGSAVGMSVGVAVGAVGTSVGVLPGSSVVVGVGVMVTGGPTIVTRPSRAVPWIEPPVGLPKLGSGSGENKIAPVLMVPGSG